MVKSHSGDDPVSPSADLQCQSSEMSDLLSGLPKNVIYEILERMPLQNAAKMSVLSKKWREFWRSLPCLVLSANFFRCSLSYASDDTLEFCFLVSKLLLQHIGPIPKFTLHIPRLDREPDITQWLSFLSMNGIKELTLMNRNKAAIKLPHSLFSVSNLTKLKLVYFIFRPPPCFNGFRCLVSLHFENIAFEGTMFEDFVASCPLLEELTLRKWTGFHQININAPNLKYLSISGTFHSISVASCQILSSVAITLKESIKNFCKSEAWDLIKFLASSCGLEKLYLGGCFLKALAEGGISQLAPVTFAHVKRLHLPRVKSASELSCAVGIIQSCPNMQELNISVTVSDADAVHNMGYNLSNKFPHLVDIHATFNNGSNTELKLIEFLLACSPMLKSCSLVIQRESNKRTMLALSRRLGRCQKATKNAILMIYMASELEADSCDSDSDYSVGDDDDVDDDDDYEDSTESEVDDEEDDYTSADE